jgi:hypothetical protein
MVTYRVESTSQHLIPLQCRNGSRGVFRVSRCIIGDRGETIRLPAMSAKRGNPNWCKPWPAQVGPHIATAFEMRVRQLHLTNQTLVTSARVADLVREQQESPLHSRVAVEEVGNNG